VSVRTRRLKLVKGGDYYLTAEVSF